MKTLKLFSKPLLIAVLSILTPVTASVATAPSAYADEGEGPILDIVQGIRCQIDALNEHLTLEQQIKYTRNVKLQSARVEIKVRGRGPYSVQSAHEALALVNALSRNAALIEQKLGIDATYDIALQLEIYKEQLSDMLD